MPSQAAQKRIIKEEVTRAVELIGSDEKLGALIGVTMTCIWKTRTYGRISGPIALAIHQVTDGLCSRFRMRPDLFRPIEKTQRRKINGRRAGSIK